MLILNDVHAGFSRAGGTTPASRERLRTFLFESFRQLLAETTETTLLINGDLFDQFEVDPRDWVETFNILTAWLKQGRHLVLAAGNHDWSPRGSKMSSFEMLATVLRDIDSENVTVIGIDQWSYIPGREDVIVVAHCSNQDLFNQKLEELFSEPHGFPGKHWIDDVKYVFVHCNYNNTFAKESDHSLDMDRELARRFKAAGVTLVFAHEHQAMETLGGAVVVMGNQWPTSIADCLGNNAKFAHVLKGGKLQKIQTWPLGEIGSFGECDWRELAESNADFVRVTGNASSNEASDVINAIASFRSKSECFVVTNAVKIEGVAEVDALPSNFDAVKAFDVMDYVRKQLDAEEMAVVEELMEDQS